MASVTVLRSLPLASSLTRRTKRPTGERFREM